ncbi:MAG: trigger factor [Xanthomonadales bacterium]|nr:trigger factor [Xanthomonadales bacterium]ODU93086.1 MAG: trigger factor [Rhodanobacter sp. SCN 66-43]OJY83745.1 MAG: trigger factor [Xanthomonadales bacterium 66-474]
MQVSLENVGKLERRLTVKFPAEQFESRVRQRISELGRNVRLKGFRPGKVPTKVIEQRFGEQVRGEVLSDLIGSTFREAVQQQNLQPVANPGIDTDGKPKDGEIAYTATFEVMPELPTVDVAILKIDRPRSEVGEVDVDKMIETLRVQRRVFDKVERAAAEGDMVIVDYAAQAGDFRHPAEGRERAATVLGGNTALAAFDEALKGHKAGEELAFEVEFPPTFPIPQLAARQAQVDLRIGEVQESKTPEVDAEFIRTFGIDDGTSETFRREVRSNLERELDNALRARLRNEVGGKLAATYADVEVPKVLENAEADSLVRAAMPNLPREQALPPAALEAAQPIAHQRVIAGLLLRQIAQSNNLRVDNRKVTERIAKIASTYEEPEQVVELYRANPQMMENVRTAVLEDQVSEWVADHADTTEVALSFDEVMHPQNTAN